MSLVQVKVTSDAFRIDDDDDDKIEVYAAAPAFVILSIRALNFVGPHILRFATRNPGKLIILGGGSYIISSFPALSGALGWVINAIKTMDDYGLGNIKYVVVGLTFLINLGRIVDLIKRGWGFRNKLKKENADKLEIEGEPKEKLEKAVKVFNARLIKKKDSISKMHKASQSYLSPVDFNKAIYISALASMGKNNASQWLKSVSNYSDKQIANTMNTIVSSYI